MIIYTMVALFCADFLALCKRKPKEAKEAQDAEDSKDKLGDALATIDDKKVCLLYTSPSPRDS